mgnify:CR=1 FL=1
MGDTEKQPDWKRFGLEAQQPSSDPVLENDTDELNDTESEENELFQEDQVTHYYTDR